MLRASATCRALALILVWTGTTLSQVVQSVSFETTEENKIAVDYHVSFPKPGQSFDVVLFMSNDGGTTFFRARSVSGDVGVVSGYGPKRITWDVFSDVDVFEGEECVAKVVAKEIHSSGEVVGTVLFGSDETKQFVNGAFIHLGWQKVTFSNSSFQSDGGFEIGVKYLALPAVVELDWFLQKFSSSSAFAQATSEVNHTGMNLSGSLSLSPVSQYFTPSVGLGYQASALYTGSSYGDQATSQVATNAIFWTVAAQINLSRIFRLGAEYKNSIGLGDRQWNQLMMFIGYSYKEITKTN